MPKASKHKRPKPPRPVTKFAKPIARIPIEPRVSAKTKRCMGNTIGHDKELLVRMLAEQGKMLSGTQRRSMSYSKMLELAKERGITLADIQVRSSPEVGCLHDASPGTNVCAFHQDSFKHIQAFAKQRLAELIDPSLKFYEKVLKHSKQHSAGVAVAKDVLDRNGLKEAFKVEVSSPDSVLNATNLDLLDETELVTLQRIMRKLNAPPIQVPGLVRNVTPKLGIGIELAIAEDQNESEPIKKAN